jgi:outer membrane cobalamin receptor
MDAPSFNHFTNSGTNKIWGTETEAHINITQNLTTTLGYGYLDPGDLTAYNPNIQLKYILTFQKDFYQVSLFGKYIRGLSTINKFSGVSASYQTPFFHEYNLLNLYSGFRYGNFTLSIKLNNLLNRTYYYLPGFKAPGISILTGIEYSI